MESNGGSQVKAKEGIHTVVVKQGESVLFIRDQEFDDLLTKEPIKGWYQDKAKEKD